MGDKKMGKGKMFVCFGKTTPQWARASSFIRVKCTEKNIKRQYTIHKTKLNKQIK
jgi:hypothetical protein